MVADIQVDKAAQTVEMVAAAAAPYLRRSRRHPAIVNAASTSSFVGGEAAAYTASKGGMLQLTRATAVALGPEVRCNSLPEFSPLSDDGGLLGQVGGP